VSRPGSDVVSMIDEVEQSVLNPNRYGDTPNNPNRYGDLSTQAEIDAGNDLNTLQHAAGPGAHGASRHGAFTTLLQQFRRFARGKLPDTTRKSLATASRWDCQTNGVAGLADYVFVGGCDSRRVSLRR